MSLYLILDSDVDQDDFSSAEDDSVDLPIEKKSKKLLKKAAEDKLVFIAAVFQSVKFNYLHSPSKIS